MMIPRYVRWKDFTWACSWVNERQVRLATIEPGQNQICLMDSHLRGIAVERGDRCGEARLGM
jgi:hypothetical protein